MNFETLLLDFIKIDTVLSIQFFNRNNPVVYTKPLYEKIVQDEFTPSKMKVFYDKRGFFYAYFIDSNNEKWISSYNDTNIQYTKSEADIILQLFNLKYKNND